MKISKHFCPKCKKKGKKVKMNKAFIAVIGTQMAEWVCPVCYHLIGRMK